MRKLLFVVTEDWYFCSHRLELAKAAIDAGFHVAVATRVQKHGSLIQEAGIELIPLQKMNRSGTRLWGELRSILELIEVYKNYCPDIVHHVAMKPMLYGSIAAYFSRVKHKVQAISGFGFVFLSSSLKARLLRLPVRWMLRLALVGKHTSVIVQNPDDVEMASKLGVSLENIHLVAGSGINIETFPFSEEPCEQVVIITLVARMLWDKGVGEFVEAVRLLKNEGVELRAVLVGEPDDSNPASIPVAQLKAWHKEGVIEWQGRREDIVNVWRASHIAALPSYREGLPKSLLEAASCGRAMVATDVPGCRSVVRHRQTGLLVKAKDSTALAAAIKVLIKDKNMRQKMGRAARQMVEQEYAEDIVNSQIVAMYQQTL